MMFRVTMKLVDIPTEQYLRIISPTGTRCHGIGDQIGVISRYLVPNCRTDMFIPSTCFPLGNEAMKPVTEAASNDETIEIFKRGLAGWIC